MQRGDFFVNHRLRNGSAPELRLIEDITLWVFRHNIELTVGFMRRVVIPIPANEIERRLDASDTVLAHEILSTNLLKSVGHIAILEIAGNETVEKDIRVEHIALLGIAEHIPIVKQGKAV